DRLDRPPLVGDDRPLVVERVAQWIDDAADEGVTDRHAQQRAERADLVALLDVLVVAEDDDADRRLFEVERLPLDAGAGELDHLAGHDAGQAVDARDAVADLEDAPRLARIDALAVLINFRLQNRNDLAGSEAHVYCSR